MGETSSSPTVSTQLQRIAEQAKQYPEMVFTTLAHLIDVDFLREAYQRTRKDSAPGIDGVTAATYAEHLEENLRDLHERLRSYGALPSAPCAQTRGLAPPRPEGEPPVGETDGRAPPQNPGRLPTRPGGHTSRVGLRASGQEIDHWRAA